MKLWFLLMLISLAVPVSAQAPALHPSFAFTKETTESGAVNYVLRPVIDEVVKKAGGLNNPYQVIGAVVRPSTNRAVLLFANAQKESQFYSQTDHSVVIKADGTEFKDLEYTLAAKSEGDSVMKLEIANVMISFEDFQKIAGANGVFVKFGAVIYQLDKDNINALHHLASEIQKDQKKVN